MYRAIGDKFIAMAKNSSHGALEGGIARDLGESESQFWRLKRVLGFRVFRWKKWKNNKKENRKNKK